MWSFHLHSSTVKIQPCYPFLPLVEYMVKALCWLFLLSFKGKASTIFYDTDFKISAPYFMAEKEEFFFWVTEYSLNPNT